MVYLIVIFTFASLFFTLDLELGDHYAGIGNFSYIVTTFRLSVGDMETDYFNEQTHTEEHLGHDSNSLSENVNSKSLSFLIWIIWLIAAFITNIIFLNFIIAVISDSYTKVMHKIGAQALKTKVSLILEREAVFTEKDLNNADMFPQYIIVRRMVKTGNVDN